MDDSGVSVVPVVVVVAVVSFVLGLSFGYPIGKAMMLSLIRGHLVSGLTGPQAVSYEASILRGEVPVYPER